MAGTVQFILGRAGSGKSRLLEGRICEHLRADPLGPPIYLLVPAQATFAHERHYALAAGVEGYARLRVVSFEMLGEDVIAECGGEAMVQVTGAGRQMLLGHLLRTHADELGYFKSVARQLGLVRELDRTFAEFERAGRSSSELVEALPQMLAEEAAPEYAALVEKTRDLALLGEAYRRALGEERLDATRRLEHVMKHLENCRSLGESRLFVDGFYRFSAFERKLLAKLAKLSRQTLIAITLDPREIARTFDETDLFFQTVTTLRQLTAELENEKVQIESPIELEAPRRFRSEALGRIERDWSMPRPSSAPGIDTSAVTLLEAPDPRAEADAAARQVKAWTDEGIRLRDIVVLCRDLSAMQPLLEASFSEHELPFFLDRRRPAAHHPLVRFVRSLLRVAVRNWPHDDVMDLCKCGLAGMSLDEADALENYALEHRIRGRAAWTSPQPWRYHAAEAEDDDSGKLPPFEEDSGRIDAIRRRLAEAIVPLADALREAQPLREHMAALWRCMEAFGVREILGKQVASAADNGNLEEAAEHRQAWEELVGLFEQAVELLGDERISAEDFVATLEYGLDLLDLAIVPPQADEVVIGDVERTRTLNCRAAVVLGLNDGTFPRSNVDATVLSDNERRLLRRHNVDVDPDGGVLQLTERFLAYRALATPSERLTLTRSASDGEGRPASPSPFWDHVRQLLGLAPRKLAHDSAGALDCIGTPRQLAAVLMGWARREAPLEERLREKAAALYQFLAEHRDMESPLGRVRRLSWRALSYSNDARLRPETAQRLYKDSVLHTSVSRLETFAACPFRHYAAHVLQLRTRDDGDNVTPRDLGTIYHGVLEQLVRRCISEKLAFIDKASITTEQIQELTREIGQKLRGRVMLSNARNEYLLKRIETTLHGVIAGQQAVLKRGKFQPLATELRFGDGEGDKLAPLELKTPRGRTVRIYGQIDRVDYSPSTGYAAVIDYKFGGRTLRLDHVMYGLALQLLVYLLVLQRNGASLADRPPQPAAALYVKLLRGIQSGKHPEDAREPDDPVFDLRIKPRGLIDADALAHLDADYWNDTNRAQWSDAYSVGLRIDGQPHGSEGNDLIEQVHFDALLAHVEREVVRLADDVISGVIDVRPYRMGTVTPCPQCDFRAVCRFDPASGEYAPMPPRKRKQVLAELDDDRQGDR